MKEHDDRAAAPRVLILDGPRGQLYFRHGGPPSARRSLQPVLRIISESFGPPGSPELPWLRRPGSTRPAGLAGAEEGDRDEGNPDRDRDHQQPVPEDRDSDRAGCYEADAEQGVRPADQ